MRISRLLASAVTALMSTHVLQAFADTSSYPSKNITIVVPYAAGGPTDITARRLAESMSKQLKATIVVENKPGAATAIAASYVAKAPKDGYTLLMSLLTTTAVNPHTYRSLPYKLDDFSPISLISRQPVVLTVSSSVPARTVSELVELVRNSPDKRLTHGSTGVGSQTHIIGQWMGRTLGIDVADIPYKGTAESTADIVAGRLQVRSDAISTAAAMHKSKSAKVLAVMANERSSLLPDVPTFKESGYPDLLAYLDLGLLAPAGTPQAVIQKLHAAAVATVASPEFSGKLSGNGEVPQSSPSPADFAQFLQREYTNWGNIIRPLNIKLE